MIATSCQVLLSFFRFGVLIVFVKEIKSQFFHKRTRLTMTTVPGVRLSQAKG